eukprot:Skav226049  [mRNA]  locus=scaffold211:117797:119184:+ [translate_table: standard]
MAFVTQFCGFSTDLTAQRSQPSRPRSQRNGSWQYEPSNPGMGVAFLGLTGILSASSRRRQSQRPSVKVRSPGGGPRFPQGFSEVFIGATSPVMELRWISEITSFSSSRTSC